MKRNTKWTGSKIIQELNLISVLCYVQFPIKLKLNFDNREYCTIWREKAREKHLNCKVWEGQHNDV